MNRDSPRALRHRALRALRIAVPIHRDYATALQIETEPRPEMTFRYYRLKIAGRGARLKRWTR